MAMWTTIDEAVRVVGSKSRIFVQGGMATPTPLLEALVARGEELRDVEIIHLHTYGPTRYTDSRWNGHFRLRALFISNNTRKAVHEGRASYIPVFLSDVPGMLSRGGELAVDTAFIHVSPPDTHGYCSLGVSVDATRAAVHAARNVIALVNPQMPRSHGDSFVHISRITHAIEWDGPLYTVERPTPNATQLAIGKNVANLVEDGATLQLGIGAIPDAVLASLRDHTDLGIHTEMFSDGVIDLVELGVVTGRRKVRNQGKMVASFVIGSQRLLSFLHDNPCVEMRPSDYTNNTSVIRQFEGMAAINSAIQVDLTGQVCAESFGPHLYSGVGGQMDFLRGAAIAPRGKPIIALPATAPYKPDADTDRLTSRSPIELDPTHGAVSRIVPILSPGAAVTSTRAHVHYVVTEHGVAYLHGQDLAERARRLIAIAAPEYRRPLEDAAKALRLLL